MSHSNPSNGTFLMACEPQNRHFTLDMLSKHLSISYLHGTQPLSFYRSLLSSKVAPYRSCALTSKVKVSLLWVQQLAMEEFTFDESKWLLKNSSAGRGPELRRVRMPYKRFSRVAQAFSIPQNHAVFVDIDFFNTHSKCPHAMKVPAPIGA